MAYTNFRPLVWREVCREGNLVGVGGWGVAAEVPPVFPQSYCLPHGKGSPLRHEHSPSAVTEQHMWDVVYHVSTM